MEHYYTSNQHAGNVVAVAAPLALWLANAAPTITAICGLMGIAWYLVLFCKGIINYLNRKKGNPD